MSRSTTAARGARPAARRRRRLLLLGLVALVALVALAARPFLHDAVQEIALPLRHEDVIRQQARQKRLDPALVAGVIYVESRFRDQTSRAGAEGLMQILPDTARFIARRSGGTAFELRDLATPQVNISYGCFYLRYLLDRFDGDERLAVAAYNGGEANVARWYKTTGDGDGRLELDEIPFTETREYVRRVEEAKGGYQRDYRRELGL